MNHQLQEYLIQLGKLEKGNLQYHNSQFSSAGATIVKRKIMGFFGKQAELNKNELADILTNLYSQRTKNYTKRVSRDDITNMLSDLHQEIIEYSWGTFQINKMDVIKNNKTETLYYFKKL